MNDHNALVIVDENNVDVSENLAQEAFVEGFRLYEIRCADLVDSTITQELNRGDSIFVNSLELFGATQESVIDVLYNLVLKNGLRIFLPVENGASEITPGVIKIMEAYRELDVVLATGRQQAA